MGAPVRGRNVLVTVAIAGGIALTGCSASTGGSVDSNELEQQVSDTLEAEVGTAPEGVDCPEELAAEAGATTRCTVTAPDGSEIGATVTVNEIDGSDVNFSVEVDDAPA